ncbi:MAG TPA: hypothetical protein VEI95_06215 [Acidobacteriota bacterium]|nr:hypothetical protein [Acidobacteriota bacterium]
MVDTYVHVIVGITVCSRIADIWTTYEVTPTLRLEANTVARRFGWRFAIPSILVGLVPYAWPPLGVIIFTASFLVAAANASKIVMAKALGEEGLAALAQRVILATPPWPGLLFLVSPALFIGALGAAILLLYPEASEWGYYVGIGMFAYALAILVWYPVRYFRVRATAKQRPNNATQTVCTNARAPQA